MGFKLEEVALLSHIFSLRMILSSFVKQQKKKPLTSLKSSRLTKKLRARKSTITNRLYSLEKVLLRTSRKELLIILA